MMRHARGAGWLTGLVLAVVRLAWPVWADYEAGQEAWEGRAPRRGSDQMADGRGGRRPAGDAGPGAGVR